MKTQTDGVQKMKPTFTRIQIGKQANPCWGVSYDRTDLPPEEYAFLELFQRRSDFLVRCEEIERSENTIDVRRGKYTSCTEPEDNTELYD